MLNKLYEEKILKNGVCPISGFPAEPRDQGGLDGFRYYCEGLNPNITIAILASVIGKQLDAFSEFLRGNSFDAKEFIKGINGRKSEIVIDNELIEKYVKVFPIQVN